MNKKELRKAIMNKIKKINDRIDLLIICDKDYSNLAKLHQNLVEKLKIINN